MTGKGGPGPSLSFVCPLASATGRAQNCGNMAMPLVATKLNLPASRICAGSLPEQLKHRAGSGAVTGKPGSVSANGILNPGHLDVASCRS